MIAARDHVNAAVGMIGRTYGTGPARLSSTSSYTDCSGLVAVSHRLAGGGEVGAYNSGALYALCRDEGEIIPFADAVDTVGALLFKPENPLAGIGPLGHVVMVRSPGVTIESRGGHGVGSWPINRLTWSSKAGLLPSVRYGPEPAPPPPTLEDEMIYVVQDTQKAWYWWVPARRNWGGPITDATAYVLAVAGAKSISYDAKAKRVTLDLFGTDGDGVMGDRVPFARAKG